MTTFHGVSHIRFEPVGVFRVPTAKRGDVFMCVRRSNYRNEERAVVEVDAEKFLALWRNPDSSHLDIARGSPTTWTRDRKFAHAAEGFSHGASNPVPLALVSSSSETINVNSWTDTLLFWRTAQSRKHLNERVGFIDGVTRTIWLLSAGVRSFPVECSMVSAAILHKTAGVAHTHIRTVADLVPTAKDYFEAYDDSAAEVS